MRKIKEVLRLKFENHLSVRQIAKSCSIGKSTVQEYFDRAQTANLTWPLVHGVSAWVHGVRHKKISIDNAWGQA